MNGQTLLHFNVHFFSEIHFYKFVDLSFKKQLNNLFHRNNDVCSVYIATDYGMQGLSSTMACVWQNASSVNQKHWVSHID